MNKKFELWRGIAIDLSEEHDENAFDSMYINSKSIPNETDDSDSKYAKHDK
jgi:hypothetical protein